MPRTTALILIGLLLPACGPPPTPRVRPSRAHPHGARPVADPYALDLGPSTLARGTLRLRPGEIFDARGRRRVSWSAALRRLATARVVFVGERHDHRAHHRVQAQVVLALRRGPGPLLIGLEMYEGRPRIQRALDRYVAGSLTERAFVQESHWYGQWGLDYRYYRPVFRLARAHRLGLLALNVPLALARRVGRRGLPALPPAKRRALPSLWLAAPRHRRVFRALLGLPPRPRLRARPSRGRPHPMGRMGPGHRGMLKRLFSAQVLRDEVMARGIERALRAAGPQARMVVLVGNGHLAYLTGVNARLARRQPGWAQRSVLCVSAPKAGRAVSRGLGDYLVGTAAHGWRQRYPALGVRLARGSAKTGLRVRGLRHGSSPARRAGLRRGDVILAVDGVRVGGRAAVRLVLQGKEWGDTVRLRIARDGQERDVAVRLTPRGRQTPR